MLNFMPGQMPWQQPGPQPGQSPQPQMSPLMMKLLPFLQQGRGQEPQSELPWQNSQSELPWQNSDPLAYQGPLPRQQPASMPQTPQTPMGGGRTVVGSQRPGMAQTLQGMQPMMDNLSAWYNDPKRRSMNNLDPFAGFGSATPFNNAQR